MSYSLTKKRKRKVTTMPIETRYTRLDYGHGKATDKLKAFLATKSPEEHERYERALTHNARYAQGVYTHAHFIEERAERQDFSQLSLPDEERDFYEYLLATDHEDLATDDEDDAGDHEDLATDHEDDAGAFADGEEGSDEKG